MSTQSSMLNIQDLVVDFDTPDGVVHAVKGVSMAIAPGEIVAIVGESGSGKSQIAMSVLGILASNGQASGKILFKDQDILHLPRKELNSIRGSKISIIFQEPMTSLDPLYRVGEQIMEPLRTHKGLSRSEAKKRALELMRKVQIPDPETRFKSFPNEMSGGQRQRIMIALALANEPDILIADEPTTALDVTTQAEILKLLAELNKQLGMSIVFITHDLDEALRIGDQISILRDGAVIQDGDPQNIIMKPADDYISDFIKDINRGRVIKVSTLMTETARASGPKFESSTLLEDVLTTMSEAKTESGAVVNSKGKVIGKITMQDAIQAMARPLRAENGTRYK